MSGLNTREKQRSITWTIYLGALLSFPADLMDTLFVNHHYESVHWSLGAALQLALVLFYVLWAVAQTSRALQRMSLALFLGVGVGTAMLARLGVQTSDARLVGKILVLCWWIAVLVVIADWLNAKVRKSSGTAQLQEVAIQPNALADRARGFLLERLHRQAADQGLALSDLELQFLDYSRITSEKSASALEEAFFQTHHYGSFKKRVRALMRDAVKSDREKDPGTLKQYYRLLRDLKRGKHDQQLILMVEGGILDARSGAEEMRDWALYILIGLSVVAILVGLALMRR
jgi:hypothetical protein